MQHLAEWARLSGFGVGVAVVTRGPKTSLPNTGGISRIYIDTHFLISLVFDEDDKEDAQHLLYTLRGHGYHTLVPQTVLGEAVAKILQKCNSRDVSETFQRYGQLFSEYRIDMNSLPSVHRDSALHMSELQKRDSVLDPTDALIVAQVLADPDSKFFFTHDTNILDNKVITAYESQMLKAGRRNTPIKIKDGLG